MRGIEAIGKPARQMQTPFHGQKTQHDGRHAVYAQSEFSAVQRPKQRVAGQSEKTGQGMI